MVRKAIALIRITRPVNCLSAFSGVVLGGLLTSSHVAIPLWIGGFVALALTAAGNLTNDCFDLEIDRINKPRRVLPSGELGRTTAARAAVIMTFFALVLSASLGPLLTLISGIVALASFTYSWKFKKSFLLGNTIVSLLTAMTFLYGGIIAGNVVPTLSPALIVLVFMLGREILKTVEDYEGDLRTGARTIAVVWGKRKALHVFCLLGLGVFFITPLPWAAGYLSAAYLVLVVPLVNLALLFVIFSVLTNPVERTVCRALAITKGSWIFWAVAMFIGIGSRTWNA